MNRCRRFALIAVASLCACGGGGGGDGPSGLDFANFQPASAILGQSLATGATANDGAGSGNLNPAGLDFPTGHVASGSLYVCDTFNHRVMGWNTVPATNGVNADFVVGAPDFVTPTGGTSAGLMSLPSSCWATDDALFVADFDNERVLVWSPLPTGNVPANLALGKPDLVTQGVTAGQNGLSRPRSVCVALDRVVVADTTNSRVMVWNGVPGVSGADADLVLGQATFAGTAAGAGPSGMSSPSGVWTDGVRLAVADTVNHRVLIWTTFPTVNGEPADVVVGQPDFATTTAGSGASKMSGPGDVASDGFRLFVADTSNNRVLVFSPFPTSSNPAAARVLGQGSFAGVTANDDDQDGVDDAGPTGRTMDQPAGVTVVGTQLLVVDADNDRVLVFDSL